MGSVLPKTPAARRLAPCPSEERLVVFLLLRFAVPDHEIFAEAERAGSPAPGTRPGRDVYRPADGARGIVETFARSFRLRASWPEMFAGHVARLEGSVADLNAAFRVELHDYYSPGGDFRGYEGAVGLPGAVAGVVRAVFGLASRPSGLLGAKEVAVDSGVAGDSVLSPEDLARLYRFPPTTGRGQRIGLICESGPIPMESFNKFLGENYRDRERVGLWPPARPGDVGLDRDSMIVLQLVATLAPAAELIAVRRSAIKTDDWFAGFVLGLVGAVIGGPALDVLLLGAGMPEARWTGDERTVVNLFSAVATRMGITPVAPSGDFGASGFDPAESPVPANVHFPAASPFVLACGGSRIIFADIENEKILHETVWNDLGRAEKPRATGGGISQSFAPPDYQSWCELVSQNDGAPAGRGVPDVAAHAARDRGPRLYLEEGWTNQVGGTAVASAVWAALLARLNEGLGANLGRVHPLLYRLQIEGRAVCRPVVPAEGADANGPLSHRHTAKYTVSADHRWNACCGLGTPDGQALLDALREME